MKPSRSTYFQAFFGALLFLQVFQGPAAGAANGETAIRGYDAVAYFQEGKPQKGNESYTSQWHDLTWYFENRAHRDLFQADPAKFAPQYDGYCAWSMTEGKKANTDPKVWQIVDGKLYLNCSKGAQAEWRKDIPGNIAKADTQWVQLGQGKQLP